MLRSHSLTALFVSLCLGWTSGASAADLVEFLGPGTTYGTVLQRAAAVAQDASQLGFSSKSVPDDRSGEFSIDVADDGVQVAVLSDDGVNVQVTDLGDSDDPLGSEPQNLEGLTNLGTGQDLPTLGQSLKLIPGTLSANHRYRFEWQYRNTIHTGDSDIDGMKVFVFGGNAELALAANVYELSPIDQGEFDDNGNQTRMAGEWKSPPATISPSTGAKVFPESLVTIDIQIPEMDTIFVNGIPKALEYAGAAPVAKLTVKNATFENDQTEETMALQYISGSGMLYTNEYVRVKIPTTWIGDVTVTCEVEDPATDPANVARLRAIKANVQGKLQDTKLKLTATWTKVPADANLPTTATGFPGEYLPFPTTQLPNPDWKPLIPMWKAQFSQMMQINYLYGEDLTIDDTANYAGITIQESLDPFITNYSDKPPSDIAKSITDAFAGPKFDDYLNQWLNSTYGSGQSTFTIGAIDEVVDCTQDTYSNAVATDIADRFLKVKPKPGDLIAASVMQHYKCKGKDLGGSMPVTIYSYLEVNNNNVRVLWQMVKPK